MKIIHWRKLLYFSIYVDTIVGLLCTVIYKLIMCKVAVNVISKILKKIIIKIVKKKIGLNIFIEKLLLCILYTQVFYLITNAL